MFFLVIHLLTWIYYHTRKLNESTPRKASNKCDGKSGYMPQPIRSHKIVWVWVICGVSVNYLCISHLKFLYCIMVSRSCVIRSRVFLFHMSAVVGLTIHELSELNQWLNYQLLPRSLATWKFGAWALGGTHLNYWWLSKQSEISWGDYSDERSLPFTINMSTWTWTLFLLIWRFPHTVNLSDIFLWCYIC